MKNNSWKPGDENREKTLKDHTIKHIKISVNSFALTALLPNPERNMEVFLTCFGLRMI